MEQPGCPRQANLIKITLPYRRLSSLPVISQGLWRGQLVLMGEVWLWETTLGQEAGRKGCREEKLGNRVDVLRSRAAMFGWTVGGDPQR